MLDVMMITYNESLNVAHSLEAVCGWANKVFIIDSGSTDDTQAIARRFGAQVVEHPWEGYAQQKNWGLGHLPFESPWLLLLDADEVVTPELRAQIDAMVNRPPQEVPANGFFLNRLSYFMDQPIRHCGFFPSWNLRLFKRDKGRYEDREVHEHIIIDDPVGYLHEPMLHWDRRGLEHYFAKHNRYSTLEARQLFHEITSEQPYHQPAANINAETRRRRWLKRRLYHRVPMPGMVRFLYMYIFRLGILDGRAGFDFCRFIAHYDAMLAMKLRRLLHTARENQSKADEPVALHRVSLATAEGQEQTDPAAAPPAAASAHDHAQDPPIQMYPEASPWSFGDKVRRAVWMLLGRPIFRISFHNWYRLRASLLRMFGAKIGRRVAIRPSVNIEVPWMLRIDDDATVGDHAILYSLGKIHIGPRAVVSQYAHLCAGTHDYTDQRFPLIRVPITIGRDVWVGADVFIGPGVTVGELSVIGARSSVYKDLPPGKVCVGNPALPKKDRVLR